MIAEESEYKGSPVLIIKRNENDKYPVSFGLSKARLILDSVDEIKNFVQKYDMSENPSEDFDTPEQDADSPVHTTEKFVYDFCNPQPLENTCPVSLSYLGKELCSKPLSWQDLFGYFLTAIWDDYPDALEYLKGKTISDFSSPLIFAQEDSIEGRDIYPIPLDEDEDISIYMHKDPNVLCKIIKILLEFCHIEYEDVKIKYEKQKEFIAIEGKRPSAYNENWIFFDFRNSQNFENTTPVFCSINGEVIYRSSWAKLFVAIIEKELEKDNSALYFLYSNSLSNVNANENFFFKTLTPAPDCHKLSNGYYVNLNYDLPALLEQIKKFCLYCGYQPEQVKIYGISKGVVYTPMQEGAIEYDFNNPQPLENTCPVSLIYFDDELCSQPLSWQDLYGYFLTAISVDYPHIIEKFKGVKISNFQYPLISSFKDLIESNEICPVPFGKNDDTFTYVHINPNVICRMIKTFLGLCNIDFENVRIKYEKQRDFIATEGERPPAYNESWIFFDFRNYYSFKSTNPAFCSINGKEIIAPTWAKLFVAIIENELQKNNYALYFLYKNGMSLTSSGRNFFLKDPIPGLNCQKLSNGYYVNLNHDLPKMLELIKKFCLYCGYQPEQIKIYGIAKGNITMQPNLPNFIPAQNNVVDFSNLGSFAHTKPLKATYNGNTIDCKSWRGLFVNIVKKLFDIYPDKFRKDINRNVYRAYYSNSGLLYPDEEGLIAPEQIYFDIFIEAHHSATDTVEQIRCFLDLCDEKYESLRIEYYYTQNNPGLFVPVINTTYSDELISAASNILSVEFPNGMRLNSTIAQKKFLESYRKFSGHQLEDAIDIDSLVLQAGIEVDGKVYYLSENARNEIKELAENAFESGSNVIFYEQLYSQNSNLLQEYEIYSSSMLKKILQQVLPNLRYDNDSFCEDGKSLEDDIISCFGDNIIMPLSDIQYRLLYASPDAVKEEIRKSDSFIYINQNECILSSAIDIDEDDVYNTESSIEQEIQDNGFSSMQSINITNTEDKNAGIPGDALREAIFNKYLKDKYSRKGSVISPLNEKTGIADRLRELCASREKITLSEIRNYQENKNYGIVSKIEIACEVLIRINENDFINVNNILFDIDNIDIAIASFSNGKIIPLKSINSFISFPYVEDYSWNKFLLASYCKHKSRRFKFYGLNTSDNIVGAIIPKELEFMFKDYNSVLSYVIAKKKDIDLYDEQGIINFLLENGYRLKRKLNPNIIQKAAAIRIEEK